MRSIPYIEQADLLRWQASLDNVGPKIAASIDAGALQKGRIFARHLDLSFHAGALAYAAGDIPGCLAFYSEGVERFQLFFDAKFRDQVDPQYVYETSEEVLCGALIVRSLGLQALANQMLPYTVGQEDARVKFITALASLLSGDFTRVEEIAESLIKSPELAIEAALPRVFLAIARNDINCFLKAIGEATLEFDRNVSYDGRGTPEAAIFVRGAALIRLYEIVNNELVPRQSLDIRLLPNV